MVYGNFLNTKDMNLSHLMYVHDTYSRLYHHLESHDVSLVWSGSPKEEADSSSGPLVIHSMIWTSQG